MTAPPSRTELLVAGPADLFRLLPFVRDYHAFEGITMTDEVRCGVLTPLLEPDSDNGRIYLISKDNICVGYVAICFGYSIELAGRDAFVDELFVTPAARGQGIGTEVLRRVKTAAQSLGVAALHLEVARTNERARQLYRSAGFTARDMDRAGLTGRLRPECHDSLQFPLWGKLPS